MPPTKVLGSLSGATGPVPTPGEKPNQDALQAIRSGSASDITKVPNQELFEAIRSGESTLSAERAAGITTPISSTNISQLAPSPVERLYKVGTAPIPTENANAGLQYLQQSSSSNAEVLGLFLDRFF
jgi:hypothetical protein